MRKLLFLFTVLFVQLNGNSIYSSALSKYSVDVVEGSYVEEKEGMYIPGPKPFSFKWLYTTKEEGFDGSFAPNWHWHIEEEKSRSPLQLFKKYDDKNRLIEVSIQTAQSQVPVSYVKIHYQKGKISLSAHDGQSRTLLLNKEGLPTAFQFNGETKTGYVYKNNRMTEKTLQQNRCLINEYYVYGDNQVGKRKIRISNKKDPRIGKIRCQKMPIGTNPNPQIVASYFYETGRTEVVDSLGRITEYHFDPETKALHAIKQLDASKKAYRTKRFWWRPASKSSRSLISLYAVEDEKGCILMAESYDYDHLDQLVKETKYGNLTGNSSSPIIIEPNGTVASNGESYSFYRAYDNDQRLIRKWEDNGNSYDYLYQNNRVIELYSNQGSVIHRTEELFDDEGFLIRKINDDGNSKHIDRLDGATERHIVYFQNSSDKASFGLPYLIEEKYLDLKTHQEVAIKTTCRKLGKNGRVEIEETRLPDGKSIENAYGYDIDGNRNAILTSNGDCIQREYDAHGNVILSANADAVKETSYDYQNHPVQEIKNGHENEERELSVFYYNAEGELIKKTDSQGNDTEIETDHFGRMTKKSFPKVLDGEDREYRPEISYSYDIFDQIVSVTQTGLTTSYRYNAYGNVVEVVYPDGSSEHFHYSLDGTLKEEVDRHGIKTIYEKDPLDRPVRITRTASSGELIDSIEKEYSGFHLIRETDPHGRSTFYRYNGCGTLIAKERPLDEGVAKTAYIHDQNGNLLKTRKWYGNEKDAYTTVATKRDEQGKVICHVVEAPNGSTVLEMAPPKEQVDDESTQHHKQFVNERGQQVLQTTRISPDGFAAVLTYDAIGRLERTEYNSPFGELLSKQEYRYNSSGKKIKQIDAVFFQGKKIGETVTRWEYESSGQMLKWIEFAGTAEQRVTSYTYDAYGNRETTCMPDGTVLYYSYTPSNTLERLHSSDGSIDYLYTYDKSGQLLSCTDLVHDQSFERSYNALGKVASETFYGSLTVENRYDLQGNRVELTLPDQSKVLYSYENTLLKKVARLNAYQVEKYCFTYDSYTIQGKPIETTMIGDLGKIAYEWDEKGLLSQISSPYFSETVLKRDPDHPEKILSLSLTDNMGFHQVDYAYDRLGQVVQENEELYENDSLYNQHLFRGVECSFDQNLLLKKGNEHYSYDQNGNLVEKTDGKEETKYLYDPLNRLIEVEKEGVLVRFYYDGCHRRLKKEVINQSTGAKQTFCYLYDGNNEIGSVDKNGRIIELRILGLGMGAEIGAAIAVELDEEVYAPIHDHRGNLAALVDLGGQEVKEAIRYSVFGEEVSSASISPWRFASKRIDNETGLYYFGKRYYSPEMGRWMTQDPLGFIDTPNRYAFAKNDPVSLIDPQGFFSIRGLIGDLFSASMNFCSHLLEHFLDEINHFDLVESVNGWIERLGVQMLGSKLMELGGYYEGKSFSGTWVNKGEMYDHCRITFINGINTNLENLYGCLDKISNAHRGTNVHFCFNATCGWTRDMFKSLWLKVGFITEEADHLAEMWKRLLEEMGEQGKKKGRIYHYAHSLGGTITLRARELISSDDLKKIHIVTFGSASIIPDMGFGSTINFISCRDGVTPLTDPITYILSMLDRNANVVMIGSMMHGPPLIEHFFHSYWEYWITYYWHLFEEFLQSI